MWFDGTFINIEQLNNIYFKISPRYIFIKPDSKKGSNVIIATNNEPKSEKSTE